MNCCSRKFNKTLTSSRTWKTHRFSPGHNVTLVNSLKLLSINNVLAKKRGETSTEITRHGKCPVTDLNKVQKFRFSFQRTVFARRVFSEKSTFICSVPLISVSSSLTKHSLRYTLSWNGAHFLKCGLSTFWPLLQGCAWFAEFCTNSCVPWLIFQ